MTRRGAALLLAPLVLVGLGAHVPALLVVGLVLFGGAAVAVAVDGRRAPGRSRLHVSREHARVLTVGAPNPVRLLVAGAGAAGARALVRDEHPEAMRASAEVAAVRLPADVLYALTPPSRGEHRFGRTVVRVDGPWRLGWRQTACGGGEPVLVDPDLRAVAAHDALARRGQLAEMGVRAVRLPGEGTEFDRVRDAVPDDPLRVVNWRATARTGRLMASELMPERAQPVLLCLDHGRLMGVGAGELTKLDHAINAALLLTHVVLRAGDRAGLMAFADHVTAAVAPRAGRGQLGVLLDAVRPLRAGEVEADYDEAFTHLSRWQRRRALLVVFTDLLDRDQAAALLRQCARLRGRHLPLVVTVRDPALDEAARRPPRDAAATYARAVASTLLTERADALRVLTRSGIATVDADARTLSPRVVNRYLEMKRRAAL